MEKISVIVPVYNREKTIRKCLYSLVNQTYQNIEILVINDGSTDDSKEIIDEFYKKYPDKIVAIHTENQGVSMARNEGLKRVSGDYVGFVDSDDYIEFTMYEKLYNKITSSDFDMVACDTIAHYPNHDLIIHSNIEDDQNINKLLIDSYAVLWNKLFRRGYVENVRFKKDFWYEDVLFLFQVYPQLRKVGSIEDTLYHYVQNQSSITYTYNDKLYQLIDNMDDILSYYKDFGFYEAYQNELEYSYVRYLFGTFIKRLAKCKDFSKYKKGFYFVMNKVKSTFPYYKKNIYISNRDSKSFYLKHFNYIFALMIYIKEKNKMN